MSTLLVAFAIAEPVTVYAGPQMYVADTEYKEQGGIGVTHGSLNQPTFTLDDYVLNG